MLEIVAQNMQYAIREINSLALLIAQTVDENGAVTDFEQTAEKLLDKYPGVNMLELIDNGVVTHIYPQEGYEGIIGHDLYQSDRLKKELFEAARNERIYLGGPSMLIEDRLGVIGILPFFIDGDYIRASAVVMYLDELLEKAQIHTFEDRFHFELARVNLVTGEEELAVNEYDDLDDFPHQSIEIREGNWILYARALHPPNSSTTFWVFAGFSLMVGLIVGYGVFQIVSKPIELERLLTERTQQLYESRNQYKKSSELLESVLKSPQNIVIFSLDREFNFTAYNQNYKSVIEQLYSITIDVGTSVFDVYSGEMADQIRQLFERSLTGESFDITLTTPYPGSRTRYTQNWFSPVKDKSKAIVGVTLFSVDITDRVMAEKEKTTLLSEIHHRVKNNLAIVSGLLELQKMEMKDPRLTTIFDQSINRIISIALVHELMYNNQNLSSIDIHAYLQKLIPAIQATMHHSAKNVQFSLEIEEYQLNINEAIPLGLLLNELITNSFKYAFNGTENNQILLKLTSKKDRIFVSYLENGQGFPAQTDFNTPKNLGMNLIHAQLTQLDAIYSVDTTNKFELEFSFISHGKGPHSNF